MLTEQTRDWERGRTERVLAGVRRYTSIALVMGLALVPPFWWLMPDLIELVFGARYLPATDAARIILVAAAFSWRSAGRSRSRLRSGDPACAY